MQARIFGEGMHNFDTLKYAKRALDAGFTKEQAEFQAEEMVKIIDDHIATKGDMKSVRSEIELLRLEIRSIENRIVIKMGSMLVMAVGVLATIPKLF